MIHCSCRHHVKVDALFNQNSNKLVKESNFYYGKLMTQKNSMSIDYTSPHILYKTTERPLRKQRFTLSSFIWSIMCLSFKRDIKRNEANVCQTKRRLYFSPLWEETALVLAQLHFLFTIFDFAALCCQSHPTHFK